jgi:hypothetical protein
MNLGPGPGDVTSCRPERSRPRLGCGNTPLTCPAEAVPMPRIRVLLLLSIGLTPVAQAQPADCPTGPSKGPRLPLALDLARRPGTPAKTTGTVYVDVPLGSPGYACGRSGPLPADVLRGEPGDVLAGPASPDLLRGPGEPRVRMEPP